MPCTLALLQEAAGLHAKLISQTVRKLRNGEFWNLDDQDGEIVARSSRIMEAFQTEAIDRFFPAPGIVNLPEVGCGSGFYIKYAANRNPSLAALGLELQPNVADVARRNINIYYFPVASRVSLLQHIRRFIKPGGFLLLITCCQGGSLGVKILNLWGAATTGGRLPSNHELISQLHHAGFQDVQTIRLIPGEELFAFKALPGENAMPTKIFIRG